MPLSTLLLTVQLGCLVIGIVFCLHQFPLKVANFEGLKFCGLRR